MLHNCTAQPFAGADSRHPFCLRTHRGIRCCRASPVPGHRRLRLGFSFGRMTPMRALLATIVLAIFLLPTFASADDTNTFSNPAIGVVVTKPSGWVFLTAQQHLENLKRATLKNGERLNWLREHPSPPLVGMMKYPEPFDDVNPNVMMFVAPAGQFPTNDLVPILRGLVADRQKQFDNFRVVEPPRGTTLNGYSSAYAKFYYDLKVPDGRRFPAWGEMWLVPHKEQLLIVVLELREDEKTGERVEFDRIMGSLKLE